MTIEDLHAESGPSQSEMEFRILHQFPGADEETAWREFLNRLELPSHYNAPEFFLEPYWEQKAPFAIMAIQGGRIAGVLTGIHKGDEVECGRPSRPQFCVDGTAPQSAVEATLFRGLLKETGSAKLITVYSWSSLATPERFGFRCRLLDGNVVVDLSKGIEALWQGNEAHRRRNIRMAIKKGLIACEAATSKDFDECYEIYRQWRQTARKKLHGEDLPYEQLQRAWGLTANRRLFIVRFADKAIAVSCFRFFPRGWMEYAENHSLDEFLSLKPNDLAMWRATEWACQHGLKTFSLGGTDRFHRGSGGSIAPIYRYRLDRTLMRRHDLREKLVDMRRAIAAKIPAPMKNKIRSLLR